MSIVHSIAASRDDPDTMIELWYQANEQCRGGSGDNPATLDACDERESYAKRLDQLGWCYGEENQDSSQRQWHHCTNNSNRATRSAEIPANVTAAFRNCLMSNAVSHKGTIAELEQLNSNVVGMLALSCAGFLDAYVHYCREAGQIDSECFDAAKRYAVDAIAASRQ